MSKFKHDVGDGELEGLIEFEDGLRGASVAQDIKPFLQEAKEEREIGFNRKTHYRKFASIPDVVSIEIMEKWGINIHNPETIKDKSEMNKFKTIIKQHYPYLLVSS